MLAAIRPNRLSPFAVASVLLIGLAVFGWGLSYKLSLYQAPHSVARRTPEAKLLSQKERVVASSQAVSLDAQREFPLQVPVAFPGILAALFLAVVLVFLQKVERLAFAETRLRRRGEAACAHFSFRPPPTLL
jgi:hypothetical protein